MSRKTPLLILSAAAWAGFNIVMVWLVAFLAGIAVPRVVDGPTRTNTALAVTVDLALLLLFAVQHSAMARPGVKAVIHGRTPAGLERTVYVLATEACLVLILALWQPFGGPVWHLHGIPALLLWLLYAAGWLLATTATYAVDHLELTGLRQAGWAAPPDPDRPDKLQVNGLHALVRHPLMAGLLVAFWATPHLGASHLLFAAGATAYIVVGIRFEERDLRRTFGGAYDAYAARVPAILPGLRVRRGPQPGRAATMGDAAGSAPKPSTSSQEGTR